MKLQMRDICEYIPLEHRFLRKEGKTMDEMKSGKGMSIAGMVLGIVSCILAWFYLVNIAALVLGVIGVVLAAVGGKREKAANRTSGIATAGLVLSIIGLSVAFIGFLSCTICVACAADAANDAVSSLF